MHLKHSKVNISVDSLSSQKINNVSSSVQLQIFSQFYKHESIIVEELIISKINYDVPYFRVNLSTLSEFQHLLLADVNYLRLGPIEVLQGADIFGEIMLCKHFSFPAHSLTTLSLLLDG